MHEDTEHIVATKPDLNKEKTFKLLWWHDWYDGEIDGMCEYRDERLWFSWIDEREYKKGDDEKTYRNRVFAVYRIPKEVVEVEEYWQSLYELCCGSSNRYNEPHEDKDTRIPENKFYRDFYTARFKLHKKQITADFLKEQAEVVGWFEY